MQEKLYNDRQGIPIAHRIRALMDGDCLDRTEIGLIAKTFLNATWYKLGLNDPRRRIVVLVGKLLSLHLVLPLFKAVAILCMCVLLPAVLAVAGTFHKDIEMLNTNLTGEMESRVWDNLSKKDRARYSVQTILRAVSNPTNRKFQADAAFEIEVSDQCRDDPGTPGFFVPFEAFAGKRDLTVGVDTAGGHLVPTDLQSENYIDVLRNAPVVTQAGATLLTGLRGPVAIPRQTAAGSFEWVAEGGSASESDIAFDQVTLSPKTCTGRTSFSRRLMLQGSPQVEELIRRDLMAGIASEIDRAAIEGDPDTTATANEPRGILNVSGIGSVALGTNGAAPIWDDIVNLQTEVSQDNAHNGQPAYLLNAQVAGKLMKTRKDTGSGRFVMERRNSLAGVPAFVSQNVPADLSKGSGSNLSAIIYGVFDNLFIGLWGQGISILVDPYSESSTGNVRVILHIDIDVAVRRANHFAAIVDAVVT